MRASELLAACCFKDQGFKDGVTVAKSRRRMRPDEFKKRGRVDVRATNTIEQRRANQPMASETVARRLAPHLATLPFPEPLAHVSVAKGNGGRFRGVGWIFQSTRNMSEREWMRPEEGRKRRVRGMTAWRVACREIFSCHRHS